ncbi:MAG: HAD family acid phosphatase [Ignavibacteriales bacterium]
MKTHNFTLKHIPLKYYSFLLVLVFFFTGCASSELSNLGKVKKEISFYYESGKYSQEVQEVVADAIREFSKLDIRDSSAVVFDIDETVLSNYPQIKGVDFGYVSDMWNEWILKAAAPAIEEVKPLYYYLLDKKVHIIFLTGRNTAQYQATYRNLMSAGFTKFDTLIVRSDNMKDSPAENFKSIERLVLTNMGYKIIGCVGDQLSDMQGGNTGIQVKLPNYLYYIE